MPRLILFSKRICLFDGKQEEAMTWALCLLFFMQPPVLEGHEKWMVGRVMLFVASTDPGAPLPHAPTASSLAPQLPVSSLPQTMLLLLPQLAFHPHPHPKYPPSLSPHPFRPSRSGERLTCSIGLPSWASTLCPLQGFPWS